MSNLQVDAIKGEGGTGGSSIYLGGVAAANLLNDYEEGTFSSNLTNGTNTQAATIADYTKIGDLVHVELQFNNFDITGWSSGVALKLDGLPESATNNMYINWIGNKVNTTLSGVLLGLLTGTELQLFEQQDNAAYVALTQTSNFTQAGVYLRVSFNYKT